MAIVPGQSPAEEFSTLSHELAHLFRHKALLQVSPTSTQALRGTLPVHATKIGTDVLNRNPRVRAKHEPAHMISVDGRDAAAP